MAKISIELLINLHIDTMLNEKLTYAEARKILGLKTQYTADELKTAFRKASSANHPDKGGSTEKMQQVNSAYETLKGTGGLSSNKDVEAEELRAKAKAQYERFENEVKAEFEKIDLEPFIKHFETAFGEKLKATKKITVAGGVSMTWDFQNESKDIWLQTRIYVSQYGALDFDNMLSNRKDITYNFSIYTTFFANGRKQTLQKANYSRKSDKGAFTNPEILYPMAKLKKGATNSGGKFGKKDLILTLRSKFKFDTDYKQNFFRIFLDKASIVVERVVFMKVPTLIIGHINDHKGSNKQNVKLVYWAETAENVKKLVDFLQHHKSATPEQLAAAFVKEIKE